MIDKAKPAQQQVSTSRQSLILVIILWLAVLSSAIAVVYVSYDTRMQFSLLENLRKQENTLQVIWGQYLLEESTWASYGRIESLAKEKLSMQVPSPEQIIMVSPDEG
ncbi:MAG: cell division protein FtsL [Pseudomonadota bacterium]